MKTIILKSKYVYLNFFFMELNLKYHLTDWGAKKFYKTE